MSVWLFCIGKGSINKPFFYVKHHNDSETTKGHRYNDKDSEEGHVCGQLPLSGSCSNRLESIFQTM